MQRLDFHFLPAIIGSNYEKDVLGREMHVLPAGAVTHRLVDVIIFGLG